LILEKDRVKKRGCKKAQFLHKKQGYFYTGDSQRNLGFLEVQGLTVELGKMKRFR